MLLGKQERLRLFFETLRTAPAAATAEAAFAMLCDTLNRIEDTHSGVPFAPMRWQGDGRLYPPQTDNRKSFAPDSPLVRYRTREHYLWIAPNGAILITDLDNPPAIVVAKAGADGAFVGTLPNG